MKSEARSLISQKKAWTGLSQLQKVLSDHPAYQSIF